MLIQSRLHVISSADAFRRKFRCWHDWLQASRRQRSALSFQRNRNCGRWCPIDGSNCAHKRLIRNFCPVGQYDFTSSLLEHSCPAHYYAASRSKMRPIVTGDPWSVCLCVRHKCKLWKRLNRSRCRLEEADLWGPKEPCIGWDSHWHQLANTTERFLNAAAMRPYIKLPWSLVIFSVYSLFK